MDFWEIHGVLFLICIVFFPRLTMLFATTATFGVLHWVGWVITPRLLAAILATTYYWDTNPVLCVFAWFNMFFAGGASNGATAKAVSRR